MVQYLAKRIGRSILTLFVIVTLVFCLLRLMPVEGYFANYEKMTEAQIQAGLQSMGLLDPLPVQIGHFWRDALHGDLGVSHIYKLNAPVTKILAQKLPISIEMGVLAMLLSLVLGIPLGLVMGRYKGRWPDKLGTAFIVLICEISAPATKERPSPVKTTTSILLSSPISVKATSNSFNIVELSAFNASGLLIFTVQIFSCFSIINFV